MIPAHESLISYLDHVMPVGGKKDDDAFLLAIVVDYRPSTTLLDFETQSHTLPASEIVETKDIPSPPSPSVKRTWRLFVPEATGRMELGTRCKVMTGQYPDPVHGCIS